MTRIQEDSVIGKNFHELVKDYIKRKVDGAV